MSASIKWRAADDSHDPSIGTLRPETFYRILCEIAGEEEDATMVIFRYSHLHTVELLIKYGNEQLAKELKPLLKAMEAHDVIEVYKSY